MTTGRLSYLATSLLLAFAGLFLLFAAGPFQKWVCRDPEWLERRLLGWFMETTTYRILVRIVGGLAFFLALTMLTDLVS